MTTGDRIRHYRLKLGLKLDQLSELSGVKTGTISALEQRSSNKSEFFAPIAKAFGLTVEQLADTTTDWDVSISKTSAPTQYVPQRDTAAAQTEEATVSYGPRSFSHQAQDLAREFDAIRSKRWQKTAYAYCMQIMNRDPLMMAWLDSLTKATPTPAAARPIRAPSEGR